MTDTLASPPPPAGHPSMAPMPLDTIQTVDTATVTASRLIDYGFVTFHPYMEIQPCLQHLVKLIDDGALDLAIVINGDIEKYQLLAKRESMIADLDQHILMNPDTHSALVQLLDTPSIDNQTIEQKMDGVSLEALHDSLVSFYVYKSVLNRESWDKLPYVASGKPYFETYLDIADQSRGIFNPSSKALLTSLRISRGSSYENTRGQPTVMGHTRV
jgi:hypothetical protein